MSERVRIGLIVPSSNTVMEVDLYRRLPDRFQLHTARMFLEETTPEGEAVMLDDHVMPAARDLGTARPHAVVFGCTSAGALRGDAYDVELCARISAVTGAETISTIASVRDAIARRGAGRIGVDHALRRGPERRRSERASKPTASRWPGSTDWGSTRTSRSRRCRPSGSSTSP